MKLAADWSTRPASRMWTDTFAHVGLSRASLFAQYRMWVVLCGFTPNLTTTYC